MEKMEKPLSNSPFMPFYAIGPPPTLLHILLYVVYICSILLLPLLYIVKVMTVVMNIDYRGGCQSII